MVALILERAALLDANVRVARYSSAPAISINCFLLSPSTCLVGRNLRVLRLSIVAPLLLVFKTMLPWVWVLTTQPERGFQWRSDHLRSIGIEIPALNDALLVARGDALVWPLVSGETACANLLEAP